MTTNNHNQNSPDIDQAPSEQDLLSAYQSLKQRNTQLEHNLKHRRRWFWIAIMALVLLLTAVDLVHWWWVDRDVTKQHRQEMDTSTVSADAVQDGNPAAADLITIKDQPITKHLGLIGQLAAGQVVNVTAPFDSKILSLGFDFGERVTKGQSLLQLDTSDLDSKMRTAQIAQIEAQGELNTLLTWSSNSTVTSAQRAVKDAEHKLADSRSRKKSNQDLFKEGIISHDELASSIEQFLSSKNALIAAHEALSQAQAKGNQEHIKLARMKLDNSNYDLEKIKKQIAGAKVLAPLNGVTLRAKSTESDGSSKSITVGSPVTAQQVMLAVGDTDALQIKVSVSELDINDIKPGLNVIVTGDSLGDKTLKGKVVAVGSQVEASNRTSLASYAVTIALPARSNDVKQYIRLGMHVRLEIVIYKNPKAVLVPKSAVHGDTGNYFVKRLDPQKNQLVSTPVKLGHSLANGIEIIHGVSPGDRIQR
ncbi:MAG: HlyD family efflux transporter periplasmic adaptor subunit [Gammaproteobacteria bacterium]|nr:HlyD family efflux transporter periplasmic adaptor subunit [Gammaproteobacteria bacterium]